ncbi:MAG: hypothetical protein KGL39_33880 [Patescibacteria group bacterium]|nr:hypothetical protein [Patescibacteria group bacterium]
MKKGMRKVYLYAGSCLLVTVVYCFAAPHDGPTFTSYMNVIMYMFGACGLFVTAEHHKSMQDQTDQPKTGA